MKGFLKKRQYFFISCASVCVVLLVRFLQCDVFKMTETTVSPDPVEVLTTFIQELAQRNPDNATLLQHTITNLQICLLGYGIGAVVGIPMGILMAWNKWCDRFIRSLFDLIHPIPDLAWVPLFIVLFGTGIGAKAMIIFTNSMVARTVNAYAGVQQTRQEYIWLGDVLGASNAQKLFEITISPATPVIFTGLRTTLGGSWMALVTTELLASSKGLGFMIQNVRLISHPSLIIVGILCIGVVGLVLDIILEAVEKVVVKRVNAR